MQETRVFVPETRRSRWTREDLAPRIHRGCILYRLRHANGALLYVGITSNPRERWRAHAQRKKWWYQVATIEAVEYPEEYLALDAERAAIKAEMPLYNIRSAAF